MWIIIIGCGRLGSGIARALGRHQHSVTVVDRDETAFERLGSGFNGNTLIGLGFDRDILIRAGIERADGFAAVTNSDEANVVAARAARWIFHVPRVVARLYDPRKAEIYRRLGLLTISTTTWGVNQITELLRFSELDSVCALSEDVDLVAVTAPAQITGRTVEQLTVPNGINVVAISRAGRTFLPAAGTEFREGDRIHVAVKAGAIDQLRRMLGLS